MCNKQINQWEDVYLDLKISHVDKKDVSNVVHSYMENSKWDSHEFIGIDMSLVNKLNTKSSTAAELVASDEAMTQVL
jgi:hypothetical protein